MQKGGACQFKVLKEQSVKRRSSVKKIWKASVQGEIVGSKIETEACQIEDYNTHEVDGSKDDARV